MKKALDNICASNTGNHEFDSEVAHEIWSETMDRNIGAPVYLREYIATMVQAESILRNQVDDIQSIS